jgi:hypothetical protein
MSRTLFIIALIAGSCAAQQLKVVKNAPFSATATTEFRQTLTDENVVTHTTTATIARDTEGRTRREQFPAVFIHDPVAAMVSVLDSRLRTARRFAVASSDVASAAHSVLNDSLGPDVINGVNVEGTRLSHVIAPGEAGNERPIQVTTETWYSTELQTIVMSKTTDPRIGETVYKLTAIQRGEPDRSLFEIPADFTLQDGVASPTPASSQRLPKQ